MFQTTKLINILTLLLLLFSSSFQIMLRPGCPEKNILNTELSQALISLQQTLSDDAPVQLVSKKTNLCLQASGQQNQLSMKVCAIGLDSQNWNKIVSTFNKQQYYTFINVNNNMVIDLRCGISDEGAAVDQWPLIANNSSQQFTLTYDPSDSSKTYFTMKFVSSGKCLGSNGLQNGCIMSTDFLWSMRVVSINIPIGFTLIKNQVGSCLQWKGKAVQAQMATCNLSDPSQIWSLIQETEGDTFMIVNGNGQALDNSAGGTANFNKVQGYAVNMGNSQKWYVSPIDDTYISIYNSSASKCLDNNNNNVVIYDCNASSTQKLVFVPPTVHNVPLSAQVITSKLGPCLRFDETTKDFQIKTATCDDFQGYQTFTPVVNNDGSYTLTTMINKAIDFSGNQVSGGYTLKLWSSNGSNNQKVYIVPVSVIYFTFTSVDGKCFDVIKSNLGNSVQTNTCDSTKDSQLFSFASSNAVVPDPNVFVQIVNQSSKKCLTGNSEKANTQAFQVTCATDSSKALSQAYTFAINPDQTYAISSYGGLVLDNSSDNNSDGNIVKNNISNNNNAQKWFVIPSGMGQYNIIIANYSKCLNLPKGKTDENLGVTISACNGDQPLIWNLNVLNIKPLTTDYVQIKMTSFDYYCLTVSGVATEVKHKLCENHGGQAWKLNKNADGYYFITNYSGLVMENQNGSNKDRNHIIANILNSSDAQKWYIIPYKDNIFKLVNKQWLMCVDIDPKSINLIQRIELSGCVDSNSQAWYFTTFASPQPAIPAGFTGIQNIDHSYCFTYEDQKKAINSWPCSSNFVTQAWQLILNPNDGSYTMNSSVPGIVFDNDGGSGKDNNGQKAWALNNEDSQRVFLIPVAIDQFYLINKGSKKCLNNPGDGKQLIQKSCTESIDQTYKFVYNWAIPFPLGSWVYIKHLSSQKCMTYAGYLDGIVLKNCVEMDRSQAFKFTSSDNSNFKITTMNGFVFDNFGGKSDNGNHIMANTDQGNGQQRYKLIPGTDNSYRLVVEATNKCVISNQDASSYSISDVYQWDCNFATFDKWTGWSINAFTANELPSGWVNILNVQYSTCSQDPTKAGDPIKQAECNKADNTFWWNMQRNVDGTFSFISKNNRAMEDCNGKKNNANSICSNSSNGSDSQKYWIVPFGLDKYYLVNKISSAQNANKCIDIGKTNTGQVTQLYDCNKANSQLFFFNS